jgi:hypothetical protein
MKHALAQKTEWWTPRLAGPVIAAAVIRLALLAAVFARFGVSVLFLTDTNSYLEPGRNLLLHGRYFADGVPDLIRTPGYSLFLAIFSLAGLPAAAVANVILSVFSVILVWKLGRAVFGNDRIALGAAWVFAFEPISVTNSVVLLSDSLFLALFLLSMVRLAVFLREHRLRALAVAGLWLAAATYVRPVTYYLPVALALGLFLVLAHVPGLRWKAPAVLLIAVLPWLAAWQIRNRAETGYGGFSSVSESNLYFHIAANLTARVEHRPYSEVQLGYTGFSNRNSGQSYLYEPYLVQNPEQAGWNQAQRLAFMHSEAVCIIRAHYWVYLRLCLTGLFKTIVEPGTESFDHLWMLYPEDPRHSTGLFSEVGLVRWGILLAKAHPWEAAEKAAFEVVLLGLYLFAARGAFRGGLHNACLWLLLGTSLYFLAVSALVLGPGGGERFRLPVMPVVCIVAAAGFRRTKTITP